MFTVRWCCLQIIMESLQKSSRRGRCSLLECEIVWRINFNVQPRIDRRGDGSLGCGRSSFKEHPPWDTPRVRSGRGAGAAASACTELPASAPAPAQLPGAVGAGPPRRCPPRRTAGSCSPRATVCCPRDSAQVGLGPGIAAAL